MNKNTVWWKLSYVTYWLSITGFVTGLALRLTNWEPPVALFVMIMIAWSLPNLYLSSFSFWHWKYRYKGSHPMTWPVAFSLFWCFLPSLFYFDMHIKPDRENKKQYSFDAPKSSLTPKYYNTLRSVFSVIGGALVGWSAFAIICTEVTVWIVLGKFDQAVAHNVGKVLTADEVEAFHVMHMMYQILAGVMCAITLCCAIGTVLLLLSGSIRWRLREQLEMPTSN